MMRPFLQCLLLAAFVIPMAAAASEPLSGRYGPLALVVADRNIYGVFSESRLGNGTSDAPQFTCVFLLEGRIEGNTATVRTWFPGEPERIAGTLRFGEEPSLQLAENHGGCPMTSGDMVVTPSPLPLDELHAEWIGTGLVTPDKLVLQNNPAMDPARKRPFLVAFDAVAVLERRRDWVRVVYLDGVGKPASGWVPADTLVTSPESRR